MIQEEMRRLRRSLTIRLTLISFFAYGAVYAALKLT